MDVFVERNSDAVKRVDYLDKRSPVEVGEILEINAKDGANLSYEGVSSFCFSFDGDIAATAIAPVNFIDFAGGSTGGGGFEVAW